MRKWGYNIVSVLFLAIYGMVLIHNSIPHTHTLISESAHDNHTHGHHHDHDHHLSHHDHSSQSESSKDLSHPFSGLNHLEEYSIGQFNLIIKTVDSPIASAPHTEGIFTKQSFKQLRISHNIERPPILYEPPNSSSDPLRGPPSIV